MKNANLMLSMKNGNKKKNQDKKVNLKASKIKNKSNNSRVIESTTPKLETTTTSSINQTSEMSFVLNQESFANSIKSMISDLIKMYFEGQMNLTKKEQFAKEQGNFSSLKKNSDNEKQQISAKLEELPTTKADTESIEEKETIEEQFPMSKEDISSWRTQRKRPIYIDERINELYGMRKNNPKKGYSREDFDDFDDTLEQEHILQLSKRKSKNKKDKSNIRLLSRFLSEMLKIK